MFELQFKGTTLSNLGELELKSTIATLMVSISIITGWKIPDDEYYMNELLEQTILKAKESYGSLNPEEIKFAFRQNTAIKEWGKPFNLILLDEVLQPYLRQRASINSLVSMKQVSEKQLTYNTESDWRELCELNYQQFLTGKYNIDIWPWQMYDEFVKQGMIEDGVHLERLERAYKRLLITLEDAELIFEIKRTGVTHRKVDETAKRLVVEYLYSEAKKMNLKQLF